MSRFFSLLLPWRDAATEEIEVPDRRLRGARPQYEASPSWLGKSSMSMEIASLGAALGPIPGTVGRHR